MHDSSKRTWPRLLLFAFWLYLFLFSIELLGSSLGLFGRKFVEVLMAAIADPFAGLFIGILTTSIVQSSSLVTSMVIALVGTGTIPIANAIPIIMGSNIGTTVTCTLVSMAHITRREEFRRAFAAATVHDFFNILTVIVLFPLELSFHYLERFATFLSANFERFGGIKLVSPIKAITHPISEALIALLVRGLRFSAVPAGIILAVFAIALLFLSLIFMVKAMKGVLFERMEKILDNYVFRNTAWGFLFGLLLTGTIQSSSVTTSVLVPIAAAGLVTLERAYPYILGANIGTTVTALMASFAVGTPAAVAIALTHSLFNITGTAIFLPLGVIPRSLARALASASARRRWVPFLYVGIVFFAVPALIIYLRRA